ncbi:hypothetical protein [Candidatus Palauibacter sp.]|uniref:hypothetical protein n=1 Tax=Candidatus Palauibacter sp. TaxID=3101350 RepID=UPI003CC6476D
MDTTFNILILSERFAGARGIQLTTLGQKAVGSGDLFNRLNEGRVTFRTVDRLVQWLSDNWPEGLEWPPHIPRPEPPAAVGAGPKEAA